jgi:hypothetical protein
VDKFSLKSKYGGQGHKATAEYSETRLQRTRLLTNTRLKRTEF